MPSVVLVLVRCPRKSSHGQTGASPLCFSLSLKWIEKLPGPSPQPLKEARANCFVRGYIFDVTLYPRQTD